MRELLLCLLVPSHLVPGLLYRVLVNLLVLLPYCLSLELYHLLLFVNLLLLRLQLVTPHPLVLLLLLFVPLLLFLPLHLQPLQLFAQLLLILPTSLLLLLQLPLVVMSLLSQFTLHPPIIPSPLLHVGDNGGRDWLSRVLIY